jgi:hypothetical protein
MEFFSYDYVSRIIFHWTHTYTVISSLRIQHRHLKKIECVRIGLCMDWQKDINQTG